MLTFNTKATGILMAMIVTVTGCSMVKSKQDAGPVAIGKMLQPVPVESILENTDYWIWGGSMIRTGDGICHLFYSRWSKEFEFKDWIFRSEIAYATASQPEGPYTFQKVALSGRGEDFWDKDMAHNPHIKKFGDHYYLYFISHNAVDLGLGERLNHIISQRIGVAVADHPAGPWKVCDRPLVDLQEGKAAHGYVTNPSVCRRPDGTYLMMMKSRPENWLDSKEFNAIHCIATAPAPNGPFTINERPVLTESTAEDPYIWYQHDRYYAIVDDQHGNYLGVKGLAQFESMDGFTWGPSEDILVSKVEIRWDDQSLTPLQHLERPQLWFNEEGRPAMLFLAAQQRLNDDTGKMGLNSFNVHIPLLGKTNSID